jgi:hypothetical protein
MTHACIPSYLGDIYQENYTSLIAMGKS